jgi:hypothetical protein
MVRLRVAFAVGLKARGEKRILNPEILRILMDPDGSYWILINVSKYF